MLFFPNLPRNLKIHFETPLERQHLPGLSINPLSEIVKKETLRLSEGRALNTEAAVISGYERKLSHAEAANTNRPCYSSIFTVSLVSLGGYEVVR